MQREEGFSYADWMWDGTPGKMTGDRQAPRPKLQASFAADAGYRRML
jgi:hypothetical protein